jgi:Tol biopolymer transport system component
MLSRYFLLMTCALAPLALTGCSGPEGSPGVSQTSLGQVPAVRLNYRYEADVPPPTEPAKTQTEERNAAVQSDFDNTRPDEVLDKTIRSPDGKRIVAVYHRLNDLPSEFRLDMYSTDGKPMRKMTSDLMAAHFPDTIRWSPDSATVAFVAMVRGVQAEPETEGQRPPEPPSLSNSNSNVNTSNVDPEANAADDVNANANAGAPETAPTPSAPTGILAFRTEQIYLADADGEGVKPVTQNEGLIYFYYSWAPDSSALAALASTQREWQFLQFRAESNGEIFVPVGRPRVVEKNGRERRLDDALTAVHPVWSPDSAKVAAAYDTQVRIYDAGGTTPTQAAIPLRNQLLMSSQAYDREQQQKLNDANGNVDMNQTTPANTNQPASTLPDEKSLVSFNPIVSLAWTADELLYLQTAFIKRMKKEADSVTSFPRWHRLILTPQASPVR